MYNAKRNTISDDNTVFDFLCKLIRSFEDSKVLLAILNIDKNYMPSTIIDVNKAFCEKLAYTKEELKCKQLQELYYESIDNKNTTNHVKFDAKQTTVTKQYLKDRNGRKLPFEIHQNIINMNGTSIGIVMLIDISEQLICQNRLDESEERYRKIVEHSPDSILICDNYMIKYANKSAVRFLGRRNIKEVIEMPISQFTHCDYYEKLSKQINYILNKQEKVPYYETKFVRDDGTEFYVNSSANYLIYNETPAVQIIIRDITEKKRAQDYIKFMAYHDNMTGLCNLTHFYDKLNNYIQQKKWLNKIASILYLDVDGFKIVNDSLGHAVGDKLIIAISNRLLSIIDYKHILARGFGDEFLILMKDTNPESVDYYANRIINGFRNPFYIDSHEFYLSMSIGISYYPENGQDARALVKNAKIALYNVKENGRDNVKTYDISLKEKSEIQTKIKNNLRRALEREEFLIHYQPKVMIGTGEIIGSEALIRWNHLGYSMVSPSDFIPIAEESRLIIPIGDWVLQNVCKQQIEWEKKGLQPMRIAVNISAIQLQNKSFLSTVQQILKDTKLDPNNLEFEITESALIYNFNSSNEVLNELRKMGISISLDDFGEGYSSLNYLRNLNIDNLKIDRSFIKDILIDKKNADIVKGIIEMAHALDITVTAEGVEENDQLELLKSFRCDYIQGYLFSKPLPKIDYEKLMQSDDTKTITAKYHSQINVS